MFHAKLFDKVVPYQSSAHRTELSDFPTGSETDRDSGEIGKLPLSSLFLELLGEIAREFLTGTESHAAPAL